MNRLLKRGVPLIPFLKTFKRFGEIQNVVPDGNCGYYCAMYGLHVLGINVTMDIQEFRKQMYDYADEMKHQKERLYPTVSLKKRVFI